jgi:pilus assembly protein FimV
MEALDKDLDVNDDDLFAGGPAAAEKFDFDDGLGDLDLKLDEDTLPEDLPADDGFAALDSTQSFAGDNEFSLDDLDLDIGSSDVNSLSSSESLAGDDLEKSLPAGDFSFDDDLALDSEFGEGSAADSDLALDDDLNVDEELSFEVSDDDLLADEEAVASLDELSDDLSLDADEFDLESFDESQGESLQDLDAAFDEIALGEEDQVPSLQDNAIAPEVELEDDAGLMPDEHLSDVPVVALDDLDASAAESGEPLSDDDLFEQALSDFSADDYAMDETSDLSDEDMDDELDFMGDADEAATKLDLARAYIDMGDSDGARDILAEVAQEGNDEQRQEAADLLSRIDA